MKRRILFVCTGNVFRSLSAEYAFKKYLADKKIKNWHVASAGITAMKQPIDSRVLSALGSFGIGNIDHKQTRLTADILKKYDAVVAMAQNHYDFIRKKFKHNNVMLFNDLALKKKTSIGDIDQVKNYGRYPAKVSKVIERTVKHIVKNTPGLFDAVLNRYFLFSDFITGTKNHGNGFPFIELYGTRLATSFMSIDVPDKKDGHILVIPRKRYSDLSDVPSRTVLEMMQIVQRIGSVLATYHGGYNILLNNGADAGQYIFHTHFHIVPRDSGDGIEIELWRKRRITPKHFVELNSYLKNQLKELTRSN